MNILSWLEAIEQAWNIMKDFHQELHKKMYTVENSKFSIFS
jgi:hypothetical protein